MYRYYPSSSLDVTFASLYELGLESKTESLIPSIDEKSTFKVATLSMLFVLRSRVKCSIFHSTSPFSRDLFDSRGRESVRSEVEIEIVFITIIVEKVEV